MALHEPSIPFPFLVYPSSKTTRKLETAITPIRVAYLNELQARYNEFFENKQSKNGEKLLDIVIPKLSVRESLNKYACHKDLGGVGYFVSVLPEGSVQKQTGVLIPGPAEPMWTIIYTKQKELIGNFDADKNYSKPCSPEYVHDNCSLVLNLSELIASSDKFFSEVFSSYTDDNSSSLAASFSMKPPRINLNTRDTKQLEDSLKTVDPEEYLANNYFSILYQERTPLPFFPKSTLPRIHILAHSNTKLVKESIMKFLITSVDLFDRRHSFVQMIGDDRFGMEQFKNKWMNLSNLLAPSELKFRQKFFDTICSASTSFNREKISSLLTKLKIKEAKLQVLLLLEILHTFNSDGMPDTSRNLSGEGKTFVTEGRSKPGKRNGSNLVGHKKRLLPTFIGTVVPVNTHFSTDLRLKNHVKKNESPLDSTKAELLIRNWFDRLCVWEAVLGISERSEDSSFSFLKTAVIPFYAKKHHKLLKELVTRSRGLKFTDKRSKSMNSRRHSTNHQKRKTVNSYSSGHAQGSIIMDNGEVTSTVNSTKLLGKRHDRIETGKVIPRLARRSSSLAGLKDLKINRNHSFASHEDFSRKTFEMVKSTSFSQMARHSSQTLKETLAKREISSQGKIFDHSKKRKLVAPKRKSNKSVSPAKEVTEIEATPLKKRRLLLKVRNETQLNPVQEISVGSSPPIISVTPLKSSKNPKSDVNIVINSSPMDSSPVKLSHSQNNIVITSPLKNSVIISEPSTQNIDEEQEPNTDKEINSFDNHEKEHDENFSTLFSSPLRPVIDLTPKIDRIENSPKDSKDEASNKLERILRSKPTRRRLQFN